MEDIIGRSNSKAHEQVEDNGGLLIFEDSNSNFDNFEEEEKNASANSPRSSSGSSFNNTFGNEDEDDDEFEDAQDEEILHVDTDHQMKVLSKEIIIDCD